MFQKLSALIVKEFIAIWQDPKGRIALIAPPIIQFFIFAFAATLDVQNVSIAILNSDSGFYSRDFIEKIKGSKEFTHILTLSGKDSMNRALDRGDVLAAIEIKSDFSKKILSGETAEIFAAADGRKSNAAQITVGYLAAIAESYNRSLAERFGSSPPRAEIIPRNWYNPNLNYNWFTITGLIGILAMFVSLSVTALSIAREKEMGTFEQLLVSPLSAWLILAGKALPALLIGLLEATAMLIAGIALLDLPVRGNIFLLYPSLVIFISAIVGIGLFISTLARTQQQSVLGVFLAGTPLIITSGFATPVENMPYWLQTLAMANPLKYFLVIVRGICLKEIPAATVIQNSWPMIIIAASTISTAAWFFRKRTG